MCMLLPAGFLQSSNIICRVTEGHVVAIVVQRAMEDGIMNQKFGTLCSLLSNELVLGLNSHVAQSAQILPPQ
eukprot:c26138_g1_i1 orf=91-306(-)